MILLPKKIAILFFVLFTASMLFLGVFGYRVLGDADASQPEKADAERMLYISVVSVSVVIVVFLFFAGRTLSISRELDKMIELNKRGDFSPELSMKKLGRIGEKITLLYFSLNSLNEKKTLKISALSGLVDFLMDNVKSPLLITDVQGTIVYVNKLFIDKVEQSRAEIINTSVIDLFPDAPYRDTVLELDKRKSQVALTDPGTPFTLIGIQNRMNELSYVIWLIEGDVQMPVRNGQPEPAGARRLFLRRIFSR